MAKIYRVHPEQRGVVVLHPQSGSHVAPDPADSYGADHPLVRAYPWLFTADEDATQPSPPIETVSMDPSMRVRRSKPRKAQ